MLSASSVKDSQIPGEFPEYNLELRDEFARVIGEFFEISTAEAALRLDDEFRQPGAIVADAWRLANPRTPDEITRFYQETDSYIYDLAADHCNLRREPVRDAIINRIEARGPRQNVLLYGDGIGNDSITIARRGHQVTYFDLSGVTSAFARYRFEKECLDGEICMLSDEAEIPRGSFDAVVCIEVLEHVPEPPSVMRTLHDALREGGIALITESFESIGDKFPSHLPENFKYAGRTHQLMEGLGFANTYYNVNPINRPMEFTKVASDFSGSLLRFKCKMRRAVNSRLGQSRHG